LRFGVGELLVERRRRLSVLVFSGHDYDGVKCRTARLFSST
jgi:hypothetical protein